jgi:hypothetical protein
MRIATEFVDFFDPQSNPQTMMSCATSAYFGSPRGLVSCKTYSCCSDKGELGSSRFPGQRSIVGKLRTLSQSLNPQSNPHLLNFTAPMA